ncbi:uncharacterized protein LOC144101835 [Amblyomma americanum]
MDESTEESQSSPDDVATQSPCTYQSRIHKLVTLFMMTAGGTNAAMFPMMFIFYGGMPFLVAYLTLLATVAMPMMQLESNLAQFAGDGNCGIFTTVPLFFGTGYALTLYVLLRVVADTLPLSDVLVQMAGMTDTFAWGGGQCPGGWSANNRTCYTIRKGSTLCRTVRSRLSGSFQRQALGEGLPLLRGDLVVLVPTKAYRHEATNCTPDLYTPAPAYDFRRQHSWVEQSFENIRAQPLLCIAALWLLVFAIAHRGFVGIKSMWCRALTTCLDSVGVTGTIYLGVERFNTFKNRFQEDVIFVLVADVASKGIITAIALLFLGHLSSSLDIDIATLIDTRSNFIVSITPQAISLATDPNFWSQVYLLWLISMMLPKFLIVPDIIIEVLSASHPSILLHRGAVHFYICTLMFVISIVVCSPGGASVVSVLAYTQNNRFRLLMVALETVVILQFYGFRRLSLSSRMMTNDVPSTFVKVCWTSIIPVTVATLMWVKAAFTAWESYPIGLNLVIAWFEMVELSFIPVFAIVFLVCTKMKLMNSLDPLPTWTPLSWEDAMVYRQLVLVEDFDHLTTKAALEKTSLPASQGEAAPEAERKHSHKERLSPTSKSTSEHFATHQYVPSDPAKRDGSPADWRDDSSEQAFRRKKSKKKRASQKVIPESGTTHVSQRISSLRRLASRTRDAIIKPKKSAAIAASSAALVPSAPIIPPPAVGIPEVEYNAKPPPANNAQNNSGESFDNHDFVIDSAAEHFQMAPVTSVGSLALKQPAQQDIPSLKSVSSNRDTARKVPTQPRATEGLEPSVRDGRPDPLAAPRQDPKLAVPHKGTGYVPAPASLAVHDDELAAPERAIKRPLDDSQAQKSSVPAQIPPDKQAVQGRPEENAPLKQTLHGAPVKTPSEGRRSASKKSSSRKHSSSLKSSSSSQKAPSFAAADAKTLPQPAPSSMPSAAALSGGTTAPPSSVKSTSDKVGRQSKIKQPANKKAHASDASSSDKPSGGQAEEYQKLVTKIAPGEHRSSAEAAPAADIAPAGKICDQSTSGERPATSYGAEPASDAASRAKAAARASSSEAVTLRDKCEAVAKGHPEKRKTVPKKEAQQRGMNAVGFSTAHQDAGSPSQPPTSQSDFSTTRKSSSARTTNFLRKLVAHRPRWNRGRHSKRHLGASTDADAETSAAAATAGSAGTLKLTPNYPSLASLGTHFTVQRYTSHVPMPVPNQQQDTAAPVSGWSLPYAPVPPTSHQVATEAMPRSLSSLAPETHVAAAAGKDDAAAPEAAASLATHRAKEQPDTTSKTGGHRKRRKRSKKHPDASSSESAENRERGLAGQ